MDRGSDPKSEPAQRLARRWRELIDAFTGGDPGMRRSVNAMYGAMYAEDKPAMQQFGLDATMYAYMKEAMSALGSR